MTTLFLDLETYCETPIKHGLHRYAEAVEITLLAYAFDDDPVVVEEFPGAGQIEMLLEMADEVVIHNAQFDVLVLDKALGVPVALDRVHCTMARALAHGLPGGLGALCDIMGVPIDKAKDKKGHQLVMLFCKPRPKNAKIRRATAHTHPVEWQQFKDYAGNDIEAMRVLYRTLPRWNYDHRAKPNQGISEHRLWQLDQRINNRGVAVDVELAAAAIDAVGDEQAVLARRTQALTRGEVEKATQRDAMMAHVLGEYGVTLPDMTASTLELRIADANLPAPLRELLAVRLQTSTSSTSKFKALMNGVSADGRLRGTLQFCGAARTGRWAGRLFQPQNLMRPTLEHDEIEAGIEAIKAGCVDLVTNNVMELTANVMRGCLVAPPGKKLVISDLSNIEGRVLPWLAGEDWKLQAFRDFDASRIVDGEGKPVLDKKGKPQFEKPDLYRVAYGRSFNIDPRVVTDDQRQVGKVMELSLGYQGAVGAFTTMAKLYGHDVSEPAALSLVKAWRAAHPKVVAFWYAMEKAAIAATLSVGETTYAGRIAFRRQGAWLRMILPSDRSLCYASPRVEDGKLSYMGVNSYTRKWERIRTYGGKLAENATQAVARDQIACGMVAAEDAGFEVVLTVHDEIISETLDSPAMTSDYLSSLLATNPPWAEGLPLAAAGFETHRYRKD